MRKNNNEINELKDRFGFDKIIDIYEDIRFKEVTGTRGGDYITYRIYSNGNITQR